MAAPANPVTCLCVEQTFKNDTRRPHIHTHTHAHAHTIPPFRSRLLPCHYMIEPAKAVTASLEEPNIIFCIGTDTHHTHTTHTHTHTHTHHTPTQTFVA